MNSFIEDILKIIQGENLPLNNLCFVLPSRRAGVRLKNALSLYIDKPIFSPEVISIESFIEDLSGLKSVTNAELLFLFYDIYKTNTNKDNLESFESFASWGQLLLQDFNEIDRYLIDENKIFDYLSAIKELNHWSLEDNKSELIKVHLSLWKNFKIYYKELKKSLLDKNLGYQGLLYRIAVENIETYIENSSNKRHVFLGFNALNTAESNIIQELLQSGNTKMYWDYDQYFFNDASHGASFFMRSIKKTWPYYYNNTFNYSSNNYTEKKNIKTIGVPKVISQAKYIGKILKDISKTHTSLSNVAVVLGDENLLLPLLNSLPNTIGSANVTMGLALDNIPLASLFEQLFLTHKKYSKQFYFKNVIQIIQHPILNSLLANGSRNDLFNTEENASDIILHHIQHNNITFLTPEDLKTIAPNFEAIIDILFTGWQNSVSQIIKKSKDLIYLIKDSLNADRQVNKLELEYLYRFHILFNQIETLNEKYHFINGINGLHTTYKDLIRSETLDFQGEPLEGLQIMGLLETRALDFETVIISGVNEGILPAGKTQNSFIPFDVKIENNLPTFKEKDAIYTYHFFRLLQRAKNVYLLYNTEVDALKGGEKSRFITQLDIEGIHNIEHSVLSSKVSIIENALQVVKKDEDVITKLKTIAENGFSPSTLTNYIRNPIDFYYEKILGIKESEEVEETIASNTLGTIIHNTLEDFYKPLEGQLLLEKHLLQMKASIHNMVKNHFIKSYKKGDVTKGKNKIIFEVAKRYVANFINLELEALKQGNTIKIVGIEIETKVLINIPKIDFQTYLTGKVDRIDMCNGVTRIIDYKSGKVQQYNLEITDWETITEDYNAYSKAFQVLTYAYMLHKNEELKLPSEAGIISFKNLKSGFLKFAKKEDGSKNKDHLITDNTLQNFEVELKKLIIEICNPNIDFIEKELN